MKAVFIAFDQAHLEMIQSILDHHNCRGFSYWENIQGRGSVKGEPHYSCLAKYEFGDIDHGRRPASRRIIETSQ